MLISAIVAISQNNVIGRDGHLPWHLSADLKRFKAITTGHSIILGRKNYDDIGRPLPNRTNYVLTRNTARSGASPRKNCGKPGRVTWSPWFRTRTLPGSRARAAGRRI